MYSGCSEENLPWGFLSRGGYNYWWSYKFPYYYYCYSGILPFLFQPIFILRGNPCLRAHQHSKLGECTRAEARLLRCKLLESALGTWDLFCSVHMYGGEGQGCRFAAGNITLKFSITKLNIWLKIKTILAHYVNKGKEKFTQQKPMFRLVSDWFMLP